MSGEIKERPILFNGEMVNAIRSGRKTQTRRVMKPQPHPWPLPGKPIHSAAYDAHFGQWAWYDANNNICQGASIFTCPYGKPGDRLWVRETWQVCHPKELVDGEGQYVRPWRGNPKLVTVYRASANETDPDRPDRGKSRWRPSIHMPRHACRLLLEVVSVRVERVASISESDAVAEGMIFTPRDRVVSGQLGPADGSAPMKDYTTQPPQWAWKENATAEQSLHNPQMAFANLWNSINKERGFGWDVNPWVWAVAFKVIEGGRS